MALTSCFPMLNLFNHSGMLCDASPTGRSTTHADVNELWMPLAIESLAGIGDQMRGCWSPGLLRRQRDGICFIHSFNWTITPHVWPCHDSLSRSMDFTADWCMELIGLEELAVVACTCTCKSEVFSWPFPVHASCLPVLGPKLWTINLSWHAEAGVHASLSSARSSLPSGKF